MQIGYYRLLYQSKWPSIKFSTVLDVETTLNQYLNDKEKSINRQATEKIKVGLLPVVSVSWAILIVLKSRGLCNKVTRLFKMLKKYLMTDKKPFFCYSQSEVKSFKMSMLLDQALVEDVRLHFFLLWSDLSNIRSNLLCCKFVLYRLLDSVLVSFLSIIHV